MFGQSSILIVSHLTTFQPSVAFHIETSHLICIVNQLIGFYMECNIELNGLRTLTQLVRFSYPTGCLFRLRDLDLGPLLLMTLELKQQQGILIIVNSKRLFSQI